MRVSSKAHYGLRMMTEFAKAYGSGALSIAEVARVEQLPLAYLEQLATQLRRGGLVESTRGAHGGYSVARPPEQISVLEVVTVLEGEVAPVAEDLDRTKSFPYEIVAQLGKLNLMGIPFPEEYGGAGSDSLAYALAVEELARVDSSVAKKERRKASVISSAHPFELE